MRGRGATPRLLGELARATASGRTDLATGLRALASAARPGPLVLISDLYDQGWEAGLGALVAGRFDVTLLHLLAPEELEPDLEGDFRLIDDETGDEVEISGDEETLRRYDAALQAWQHHIREWCRGRGVVYLPISSATSVSGLVTGIMRRRGVVG
jgi:hypothetical protein